MQPACGIPQTSSLASDKHPVHFGLSLHRWPFLYKRYPVIQRCPMERSAQSNFPEQGSAYKLFPYVSSRHNSSIARDNSNPQHDKTQHRKKNSMKIAKDVFETLGHTIPRSVDNCQTQSVYTDYRLANSISSSMHLSVACYILPRGIQCYVVMI